MSITPNDIKVLVGCEFSGTVREAFLDLGFDAWSCDLLPDARRSNRHIQDDVRNVLASESWDLLMVAHPPCTRLCNSGVRWLTTPPPGRTIEDMWAELHQGADLFSDLLNADVPHIAIENPVMHRHAKALIRGYREFTCSSQPWEYGDFESKRTCFWTRRLPALVPTYTTIEEARIALGLPPGSKPGQKIWKASPGKDRWRERSKFFPGMAKALAYQWGRHAILTRLATRMAEAA